MYTLTETQKEKLKKLFESRVNKTPTCWLWTSTKTAAGYGQFSLQSDKVVYAHRLAYFFANGAFSQSKHILHTCDNPSCVNPEHLFLGDDAANSADKVSKNRQARGSAVAGAILTERKVVLIKGLLRSVKPNTPTMQTDRLLAELFKVTRFAIKSIRLGTRWRHV